MIPYFLILTLLLVGCISKNKEQLVGKLAIFLLFCMSIFRATSVGLDTYNYVIYDSSYVPQGIKTFELTYNFLYNLIPLLGSRLIICFFSIITFLFLLLSCKRFNIRPVCAFFFFVLFSFFDLSLNIARQYTTAALLLYAYSFLYENGRKRFCFFLFIFIAGTIHSSAWAFSILYIARFIRGGRVSNKIIISIFIVFAILIQTVLKSYFVAWSTLYAMTMSNDSDLGSYNLYFNQAEVLEGTSFGGLIISYGMIALNVYVLLKLKKHDNRKAEIIAVLFTLSILISMFFEQLWGNIGRIRFNLSIINIIAYSYYFMYDKDKFKVLVFSLVLLLFGYNYYFILSTDAYGTVPYKFMF